MSEIERENWVDIQGWEGLYQISNHGRVRSLDRLDNIGRKWAGKVLKPKRSGKGYFQVQLCKNNKHYPYSIHRLVGIAFVNNPNPERFIEVGHYDDNKQNNFAINLYWTDHASNMNHNGLMRRINTARAKPVIGFSMSIPDEIIYFSSPSEAARQKGFCLSCICDCCKGKQHSHRGYRWEYAS